MEERNKNKMMDILNSDGYKHIGIKSASISKTNYKMDYKVERQAMFISERNGNTV